MKLCKARWKPSNGGDREVFLTAARSDSRPVAISPAFSSRWGSRSQRRRAGNYPAAGLFQWGQHSLCQLSLSGYMTWVEPAGASHRNYEAPVLSPQVFRLAHEISQCDTSSSQQSYSLSGLSSALHTSKATHTSHSGDHCNLSSIYYQWDPIYQLQYLLPSHEFGRAYQRRCGQETRFRQHQGRRRFCRWPGT